MVTNLFSVFDPCTGLSSMNWISSFIMMFILPMNYWVVNSKPMIIFMMISKKMNSEMNMLMNIKGLTLMIVSMFVLILINNMMGLLPYVFTASSHLVFSLSMALPMWMGLMMYSWTKKTNAMFCHLVPVGTPNVLMPSMVLIETISNFIRPGSLSVRLTANMIAGHLLMSLLGNSSIKSQLVLSILMILLITIFMFQTAVAIIQSYVFTTLATLYSSEI